MSSKMVKSSEIVGKLNLRAHQEGGFFAETFRDSSVFLSTSQLPPTFKVDRAVSTSIYFLLPSGSVSRLHRIPMAETWHFYLGEPLTVIRSLSTRSLQTSGLVRFLQRMFIFLKTGLCLKLRLETLRTISLLLAAPALLLSSSRTLSSRNALISYQGFRNTSHSSQCYLTRSERAYLEETPYWLNGFW
uniref:DUF985 domain-containing protein n=1 Tax=Arabidopsis thaliana TaxID=3702 RepID=Q8LDX4_ARATH|nr:unknown [Arabidopsis thaliana]